MDKRVEKDPTFGQIILTNSSQLTTRYDIQYTLFHGTELEYILRFVQYFLHNFQPTMVKNYYLTNTLS